MSNSHHQVPAGTMLERVSIDGMCIRDLYASSSFRIDKYQRPYDWRHKEWAETFEDLVEHHELQATRASEYHIGEMQFEQQSSPLELGVSDGQQRLITFAILLAAMGRLGEEWGHPLSSRDLVLSKTVTQVGDEYQPRIFDQCPDETENLTRVLSERPLEEVGSGAFALCYRFFVERLDAYCTVDGRHDPARLAAFRFSVLQRTVLTRTVFSAGLGQQTFARSNSRGKQLSFDDRIKSEFIALAVRGDDVDKTWEHWRTARTKAGDDRRALHSWVMADLSTSGAPVRDKEAHQIIRSAATEARDNGAVAPLVERYADFARALERMRAGLAPDGVTEVPSLKNIGRVALLRSQKQLFQVLPAGRHLPLADFEILARAVEDTMMVGAVCQPFPPDVERLVASVAVKLRDAGSMTDTHGVAVLATLRHFRDSFAQAFADRLVTYTQQELKNRVFVTVLRYLEAHARAWLNGRADAQCRGEVALDNTLEHILPQALTDAVLEDYGDEAAAVVDRFQLGNLCLLERVPNASVANGTYAEKLSTYRGVPYRVTSSLAHSPGRSKREQELAGYLPAYAAWDPAAVQARSVALYRLACQTFAIREAAPNPRQGPHAVSTEIPQADSPKTLLSVLCALATSSRAEDIAVAVGVDLRQVGYYLKAATILGLVVEDDDAVTLSGEGRAVTTATDPRAVLRDAMRESELVSGWQVMTADERSAFLASSGLAEATIQRRAATLNAWVAWCGPTPGPAQSSAAVPLDLPSSPQTR